MKYQSFALNSIYQNGKFTKSGSTATQLGAQPSRKANHTSAHFFTHRVTKKYQLCNKILYIRRSDLRSTADLGGNSYSDCCTVIVG